MLQLKLNTHISGSYNQELENLRNSVLTMGGLIEQQMQDTLDSIQSNNLGMAEKVVLNDIKVNSFESQIDEECLRIIAKRHPTAGDLRLVMTVSKATNDIERMGDEIERIAKLVTKGKVPDSEHIQSSMLAIGQDVMEILRGTLDAFARLSFDDALSMHRLDDVIDAKYKKLLTVIVEEMQNQTQGMQDWLDVLWALRSFERIGDRCKNICEYVMYLTHGEDIRHQDLESFAQKVQDLRTD